LNESDTRTWIDRLLELKATDVAALAVLCCLLVLLAGSLLRGDGRGGDSPAVQASLVSQRR
jgi:hypothetical protein